MIFLSRLSITFSTSDKKAQLVAYLTAGYPHPSETVDLLLAIQSGGAAILELGVPFTDPQADGATIQKANETALSHGVSLKTCIEMVCIPPLLSRILSMILTLEIFSSTDFVSAIQGIDNSGSTNGLL